MKLKKFDLDNDYSIAEAWWKDRDWKPVPKGMLSKSGLMAVENNKPVAACWLYPIAGSELCWVGFPIADKNIDKELRNKALDFIFHGLHEHARSLGYKYIITTTNLEHVKKRLENYGYVKGDENITQYVGGL
jgi:hypothetical protein